MSFMDFYEEYESLALAMNIRNIIGPCVVFPIYQTSRQKSLGRWKENNIIFGEINEMASVINVGNCHLKLIKFVRAIQI